MLFQHLSLRSLLNVTSAVRQAVERTSWFKKRQRYRVLYWREISPLAVPILLENACVLLMGVLSTFLVSWLGKEAMAGVGLADSFNMVIMSFFAAIDLGTTVVVAFSLGKRDRRRARAAARQSLAIMTLFSILLAGVIHAFGQEIIDFVAGDATAQVKDLALTYLELTALSYPAAAIALIGSGALRGAGTTKIPLLINGGMNILNILISSVLIYGIFSWPGLGFVGAGLGLTIARYIGAIATIWVLMVGLNPALRLSLKGYFKPFNFAIIWEVMGIGIPASIESVLFNGGKLLTQMFVAGMGTNVIAGNFIAFSVASLINLPGNALGSASTIITGKRLGKGQIGQAEFQAWHVFWLSTIILTLIAWGPMVRTCLDAAKAAEQEGRSIEVLDVRSLQPLDMATILESVGRTSRAIVVHEAARNYGPGAEIAARLSEELFYVMESPVLRVTGYDTPYPPSSVESDWLPNLDRVLAAVDRSMAY